MVKNSHKENKSQKNLAEKQQNRFKSQSLLSRAPVWLKWGVVAGAIGVTAYFALRDSNRTPLIQQQPRGLQEVGVEGIPAVPKVSVRQDGWRVYFRLEMPQDCRFNVNVYNAGTGDTLDIGRTNRRSMNYYFATVPYRYNMTNLNVSQEGIIVPLSPIDKNRVIMHANFAYADSVGKPAYLQCKIDSVFVVERKYVFGGKLPTIYIEKECRNGSVEQMQEELAAINSLVPAGYRFSRVVLGDVRRVVQYGDYDFTRINVFRPTKEQPGYSILGSEEIAFRGYAQVTGFHEGSHLIYEYREDSGANTQAMVSAFESILRFYGEPTQGSFSSSDRLRLENIRVFALFDESHYLPNADMNEGHPYENGGKELFASASAVMRHFREEFIDRFRKMRDESPQEAAIATDAAREVLRIWGPDGRKFFSQEIYDLFGL